MGFWPNHHPHGTAHRRLLANLPSAAFSDFEDSNAAHVELEEPWKTEPCRMPCPKRRGRNRWLDQ